MTVATTKKVKYKFRKQKKNVKLKLFTCYTNY